MKTSELIKHVAKDLLDDRTDMLSGESDELFSDSLIAKYLTEGQRLLCRHAWVLEDTAASAATRLQLVAGKIEYPLDKSIMFVKSVRLSDSDVDLVRVGYNDNRTTPGWPGNAQADYWDVNAPLLDTPGRPGAYSLDMGQRVLRLRRPPDATSSTLKLHLNVVRMPLKAIVACGADDAEPEVPEEFHMALAEYAAGRCLAMPTVDASLRSLSKTYLDNFKTAVAEAKRDRQRFQQSEPRHRFGAQSGAVTSVN